LWRAVDQHGAELDVLLQKRRDKAAAKRFFKHVLASCAEAPRRIVTDQLRSYPAAKAEIPELAHVRHVFVKASARVNNRAENSHQPTRERERRMRGFRVPERTGYGANLSGGRKTAYSPLPHRAERTAFQTAGAVVSLRRRFVRSN
jgi:putative transposase